MYDAGIGIEKNPQTAFELYRKSASTGFMQGQFCLGEMYFSGRGKHIMQRCLHQDGLILQASVNTLRE